MTAPKAIKIGPYAYKVVFSDDLDPDLYGLCEERKLRLLISNDQAPEQQRETVVHEMLHAIFATLSINHDMDHDEEERIVGSLATGLLMVLRDNPRLLEYIRG